MGLRDYHGRWKNAESRVMSRFLAGQQSRKQNIKSHGKWRKGQPRVLLDLGATLLKIRKTWHFQTESSCNEEKRIHNYIRQP